MDTKALVTLLAIVNPLACIPFFIHYTQGFSPKLVFVNPDNRIKEERSTVPVQQP